MKRLVLVLNLMLAGNLLWAQEKGKANFEITQYDFGEIQESDGPVDYKFEFTNSGNSPLMIRGVRASCGCTTPAWTKEEIGPGEKGFIQAQYNPRNRPGSFHKSLTVTTDGDPQVVYLYINGKVIPRPKTIEEDFRVKVGGLRFKSNSVNVGRITTERPVEHSIEVYNDSDTSITFREEIQGPEFIKVSFEPLTLESKKKGLIKVWYDPVHDDNFGFNNHSVEVVTDEKAEANKKLNVLATITEYFPPVPEDQRDRVPRLNIADRVYDFGKLNQGTVVETVFEITNQGKQKLNVRKIKSNCACVIAEIDKYDIKPGKSTKVTVRFDSKGRRGNQIKSVTLYTNDPIDPTQQVSVKANVVAE